MEEVGVLRSRMMESEKWRLYHWVLPENNKKIKKFDRIPTDKTYLIPLTRVETSTVYNERLHDPSYNGTGTSNSLNIATGKEPLNNNSFRAGASFFAEISAKFGKTGLNTPPEFLTNETAKDNEEITLVNSKASSDNKEKSQDAPIVLESDDEDDDEDVLVIDEGGDSIAELEVPNQSNSENFTEDVQNLEDESHLPIIDVEASPTGITKRRPSLNIFSDNTIKMIFDKSNQMISALRKDPESVLEVIAETTQNKENENKTNKNGSKLNEVAGLEKQSVPLEIDIEYALKIGASVIAATTENALAKLAVDYDLEEKEENSNKKRPTGEVRHENELLKNTMISKYANFEKSQVTESRINNKVNNKEIVVHNFQSLPEKSKEITENIMTQIIDSEMTDPSIQKNSKILTLHSPEKEDDIITATNKDCESREKTKVSENFENENEDAIGNEKNETATKTTETNGEVHSATARTESDEIMTFHKGTEQTTESQTTKKVSNNKRFYKILRKNGSKKSKSKSLQTNIPKSNEPTVENNCPSSLQALIEAEVEALMRTTIMKELQKSIVNKILKDTQDLKDNNMAKKTPSQETPVSPSENNVVSVPSQGLFSPSLFPVEEVSSEIGAQNPSIISPTIALPQIAPSRCPPDCGCRNNANISNAHPPALRVGNNFNSQMNLANVQSLETDGLFYSDIQVLKSKDITYNEIQDLAQNFPPPTEKPPKTTRKRKSAENGGEKTRKPKQKKQAENMSKARVNSKNKTTSALQLIGLDVDNVHEGYNNNNNNFYQRKNDYQMLSPNLNFQMPPQSNYNANSFMDRRNGTEIQNCFLDHNIRNENQPHAMYHYYPQPGINSQNNHSKENMKSTQNLPVPSYPVRAPPPPMSLQPPPPPCVQPLQTSISRHQMLYEQITPPVNLSPNPQQPNMDLPNNNYENQIFFLTPGDHQAYLARQQISRVRVTATQQLPTNPFEGQPSYNRRYQE